MASDRQIAANRRNAQLSTGPRSGPGKLRTRRNALKHGLTARAIVDTIESSVEFGTFHDKVAAAYQPRSILDEELIHRLVGVLWRLRRVHAIETALLTIQSHLQNDLRRDPCESAGPDPVFQVDAANPIALAHAFLRLSNINGDTLDRLSRYEVTLWRQAAQLLFLLESIAKPKRAPRLR